MRDSNIFISERRMGRNAKTMAAAILVDELDR